MIKRLAILTAVLLCTPFISTVFAIQYDTPLINRYGQTGLFSCQSAKTLGMGRLSVGIYGNYSSHDDFVVSVVDSGTFTDNKGSGGEWTKSDWKDYEPSMKISTFNFSLGYGITRYIDFAVMLPLYIEYINGHQPVNLDSFGDKTISGLGDLELSLKWQYPPYPHKKFFEMAYYGALSLPTGDKGVDAYFPRHSYYFFKDDEKFLDDSTGKYTESRVQDFYTSNGVEVDMKMVWTFDFDELRKGAPIESHINFGVRWTPAQLDHIFLLNAGLLYRPVNFVTFFTEFVGETRISNVDRGFKIGDDPLRLSPGITLTPPGGFFITLGLDISLASDTTYQYHIMDKNGSPKMIETQIEPQYRFVASIGWAGYILPQDKDKDGIKDNEDRCPEVPEDFDGFEDGDGCPEYDNDQDGIPDSLDRCPNDKEDMDGFEDADGCPDYDNDKDGVQDVDDKCPIIPEDIDGFEDRDGCPDYDNDKDGIPDSVDHCPDKPEDKDGFQDNDGCPDTDNDMDGILDVSDKCPNEPETYNAFEDDDGCPDEKPKIPEKPKAKEIKRGRVILRGVNFEFGSAKLTGDSYAILDQVYASLVEWPEIKIEIRGHTDSIGSRISNKKLSYSRAQSVRNYLVTQGIESIRIIAVGMGENEPISDNNTADGRAVNRRVELHRID